MPVIERPLGERVEKVRIAKKKMIDLEKDDLVALFKHKNVKKDKVKMNVNKLAKDGENLEDKKD